ncbi:MAG: hypothetical protein ACI88G_000466 [Woeseiaceae bacterium]|jgi:hypothetical protein
MQRILTFIFCIPIIVIADDAPAAGSPLFASAEPIKMTITAPMRELVGKRKSKPQYEALLQFEDANGIMQEMTVGLKPRGNSRLDVCSFPPLRLTIDPQQAAGTVFENQGHLKMVTQCKTTRSAADWLQLEYGIYLAYNQVSDYSYRARRVDVTFHDTESERWERKQSAFLIEPTADAAARLQREVIRPPRANANQFNKKETANSALFQFLIGNTDFAIKRGPSGEGCCHNNRLLAPAGSQGDWIALPYDFDQAGLINTDYALPDAQFRIKKVTARLYRGFCWHHDELIETVALFKEHRDKITAAIIADGLSNRKLRSVSRYIDGFYNIINEPKNLQRQIVDRCRGSDSLPVRKTTVTTQ